MNQRLVHRGPDDDGFYVENNVGLAMRRLSIIDLHTGKQPISNEDGTIWIVYNGEVYNHAALRAELQSKGHRFRTKSDTETIVHLYEEYGEDCVSTFRECSRSLSGMRTNDFIRAREIAWELSLFTICIRRSVSFCF